ncbi:PGA synthase CapB [Halobacillus andaensis]|uniref:PGA synthase CapB n=1 Tax=Halobacillus andaensis TaxID=1176239 RepID=A0A917B6J0_HALAA|nr:poly-gamma-glutamate synthase PgsB [Halobacillus andaensis]MBP2004375.1 poly-gamma-glutamate synthase PgsB/CapB [Halobacillus andaensis]GGF22099.1 PGA synthase CapB [Halobacillus andaensis]
MLLIPLMIIIALTLGIFEIKRHQRRIQSIPIRVNVNGVRGKSTVTRLVTGVLKEAGKKTVGKTTGTSARMIYWNTTEEKPIQRRLEGPNISEQKAVVAEAKKLNAEALVSECMAVNPDYQITFQNHMLQANIGVIVNVLEDHLDVMGPTLDEVAEAFTATIPYRGCLILADSPYTTYFRKIAKKRKTRVIMADNSRISEEYLRKFEYMVFPDNASLALAVAEALNIDEETALRGMLKAQPDPGAMRILPFMDEEEPCFFVNGFAANDAASTLTIWRRIQQTSYPHEEPIVIMNCREDRFERTELFAQDVLPHIQTDRLVLIGEVTHPIVESYQAGEIPAKHLMNLENYSTDEIYQALEPHLKKKMIYGVGNIHGAAEPLIEKFKTKHQPKKELVVS